jgi:serine/threonine-protein kinase
MQRELAWRAQQIFETTLERPPETRRAFLRESCSGDDELFARVESLLAHDGEASRFLAQPYVRVPAAEGLDPARSPIGAEVGSYRIVRELGRGGMGSVYLAERNDDQYRQQVAIKVLRGSPTNLDLEQRFRVEREILATLVHPNITRLLDAGNTPSGESFLVMEYVRGMPITRYCNERRLPLRARIELFCTVCDAVRFAHQHLVVHRDLKPANILVSDGGEVKLLDFGIAKLLEPAAVNGEATATQLRILTPNYASPEHLLGQPMTTGSDVFSLGVVLYELLCGRRPYDWGGRTPWEIAAAMREGEARPPSVRLSEPSRPDTDGSRANGQETDAVSLAAARSTSPEALRRRLRGDLDMITLQALRFEARDRFASADDLAEDLRRHLAGRTVRARPATLGYRLGRYLRRHAAALVVGALLLALSVATSVQSFRAVRERDRARLESARAEQASEFLLESFELADPTVTRGETITLKEVLESGANRIRTELVDQPELQARLLRSVGVFYSRMALNEQAREFLDAALELQRSLSGDDELEVAATLYQLSLAAQQRGDYEEAESRARESLALHRRELDPSDPRLTEQLSNLAVMLAYQGRDDEAGPLLRQALELLQRAGAGEEERITVLHNLAGLEARRGNFTAAEELFRQLLDSKRKHLGDRDPTIALGMANLGVVLTETGQYAEALELHRGALERNRELFGDPHPVVARSRLHVAWVLHLIGDFESAEPLLRQALAARRQAFGERHSTVADSLNVLANLLTDTGAFDEAARLFAEALEIREELAGEESRPVATTLTTWAVLELERGELEAAESRLRHALGLRRELLREGHQRTADTLVYLAEVLAERGELEEAHQLAGRAAAVYGSALPAGHWRMALADSVQGKILARQGRVEEAQLRLREAHRRLREVRGERALWTRRARRELATLAAHGAVRH